MRSEERILVTLNRWTGPPVDTHTYLLTDPATREGWVIDAPFGTAHEVLRHCREHDVRLSMVFLTHGHFDHLLDVSIYVDAGIPIGMSPLDRPLLQLPQTEAYGVPYPMPTFPVSRPFGEGDRLRLGDREWVVWHMPGHAPGHLALIQPDTGLVIGGDLLFRNAYGRIDLPLADAEEMTISLSRLLECPDSWRVLPGHGEETTIGAERSWLGPLVRIGLGVL